MASGTCPPLQDPAPPPLPPPSPRPSPGAVAHAAPGAPAEPLSAQVRSWASERCRRTSEHSASLDGLLADYRHWSGGAERVAAREFEAGLGALGAVVHGHAVVVGLVLRF